jgi:2,3-bisphosphoglycerate-dependent phosphoglycerate mutase
VTEIYFVRHAQSDNTVRDGRIRPLTEKGRGDCRLVTEYLSDKGIAAVFSSPFRRAIDTVAGFAALKGLEIHTVEDFRERKSDADMLRNNADFLTFMERQWADFEYTISDGECLAVVQRRNIAALEELLLKCAGKSIVIGTHGTALSTIINYYDSTYGFKDFMAMVNIMPWIVRMLFDGMNCLSIEKVDLFAQKARR